MSIQQHGRHVAPPHRTPNTQRSSATQRSSVARPLPPSRPARPAHRTHRRHLRGLSHDAPVIVGAVHARHPAAALAAPRLRSQQERGHSVSQAGRQARSEWQARMHASHEIPCNRGCGQRLVNTAGRRSAGAQSVSQQGRAQARMWALAAALPHQQGQLLRGGRAPKGNAAVHAESLGLGLQADRQTGRQGGEFQWLFAW